MASCYPGVEGLKLVTEEIIKPEPQYSTFSKYLAKCSHLKDNKNETLLYLTNAHGLQLRSDFKYYADKREETLCEDVKNIVPFLDFSHMNLFKDYGDILEKIKSLPEEWTVIQITDKFTPLDVLYDLKDYWNPGVFIARFSCGKLAERINPYYVTTKSRSHTKENFMQLLKDLLKIRRDYFTFGGTSRKIKEEYANTDQGLMKFLFELENHWLKEWRCLLGGRLEDEVLEKETRLQVRKVLENFLQKSKQVVRYNEECLDMIYQATLSAHFMKNKEILTVLNHALYNNELKNLYDMVPLMEELKRINLENSCAVKRAKKNPVILIIDNALELIPWEMLSPLSGQPVSRILSLHLLYALFKYHEPNIINGYRRIKVDSGYCLVNPSKDLHECEKEMSEFLKTRMPWIQTEMGKVPDPKSLVSKFQEFNVFFYCGHGSGMQYLKSGDLKKAFIKGLVLLFGCSSNLPKSAGGRTPYHNDTYTYITNGCPCLIGCLYDITSSDADIACKEMLSSFLPSLKATDSKLVIKMPEETDVLRGVVAGKVACKKYWSQCSFVARGIPCKTEEGGVNCSSKHELG